MASTQSSRCVTVTLSDCRAEDAHAVIAHLTSLYAYDEAADARPAPDLGPPHPHHPTVWQATLDVTTTGTAGAAAVPPAESRSPQQREGVQDHVEVTLQGAPHDLVAVRAALADIFTLLDEGMVLGDQEEEVQLRLSAR